MRIAVYNSYFYTFVSSCVIFIIMGTSIVRINEHKASVCWKDFFSQVPANLRIETIPKLSRIGNRKVRLCHWEL